MYRASGMHKRSFRLLWKRSSWTGGWLTWSGLRLSSEMPRSPLSCPIPRVSPEKKKDLLDRGLKGVSPTAMNLAQMLVARNRLHLVQSLAVEYKRLMNAYGGVELAEVTTAVPISTEEGERVGKGLAAMSGKRVTLELGVDPEILGRVRCQTRRQADRCQRPNQAAGVEKEHSLSRTRSVELDGAYRIRVGGEIDGYT